MPWSFSRPARGGGVGARDEEPLACRRRWSGQLVGEPQCGAEQLAVDVDLALVPGAVADPHRPAVAPALEVRQLALGEVVLAADAEHDLQPARPARPRTRRPWS